MLDDANHKKYYKSTLLLRHAAPAEEEEAERLIRGRSKDTKSDSSKMKSPHKWTNKSSSRSKQYRSGDTREREREKKKRSTRRKLAKGLSPPKESPRRRLLDDEEQQKSEAGTFDKTQWERTRWRKMYKSMESSGGQPPASRQHRTTAVEKKSNAVMDTPVGTTVPGEARQIEQVRGEHLKEKPKFQLIVLGIESAFCAITMSVWGGAADNPFLPFLLTLINLLFVFSILCGLFAVELCRFQVKKQERDEEVGNKTQHMTKYQIPYRWRFWLLGGHVARAILLCACITIMALDNDFDGGSIAVLAIQPFHLIIVSLQIFVILRPKRKE